MLEDRRPRYRAYLLRCWERGAEEGASNRDWRFSLEDPHTGQRRNFAGMETLIAALRSDLIDGDSTDGDSEEGRKGRSQ